MMKKIFFSLLALALLLSTSEPALALALPNPLGEGVTDIPSLINRVILGILGIIGALSLLMFVWGGLLWMTSGGNADQVKKGKETLVWATLGLVVIFASYTFVSTIFKALTS